MALAKQASNCSQGLLYSLRCPKSFLATRACVALCGGARCMGLGMRHAACGMGGVERVERVRAGRASSFRENGEDFQCVLARCEWHGSWFVEAARAARA